MKSQIKYILTPITVLALVAVGACMNGRVWKSQERTVIVALDGDDKADGKNKPVATLERARDIVREAREKGDNQKWTIAVEPGRYSRESTFELTEKDFNTLYKGVPAKSIFSGGIVINGWKNEGNGVWSAAVPGLAEDEIYFEQLFVDNVRATRARWPKKQKDWKFGEVRKDFFNPEGVRQIVVTNELKQVFCEQFVKAKEGDLSILDSIPQEELRYATFVIHYHWDSARRIILGYDKNTRELHVAGKINKPWNPWRKTSLYYVENVRTAFTEPGEWFLDKAKGKVYYRPLEGEDMNKVVVQAPRNNLAKLMQIKGSKSLSFEGLTFEVADEPRRKREMTYNNFHKIYKEDISKPGPTQAELGQAAAQCEAMVVADNLSDSSFTKCLFRNTGEYGLWIRNACTNNLIEKCAIEDVGAGGLRLCGFPNSPVTCRNTIRNCIIRHGGRVHPEGVGIWIGEGCDNVITHNHIHDFYYTGISIGWCWHYLGKSFRNEISWNLIEDIGQAAMADMGGIYTLGIQTGTKIINNVFRRIDSYAYGGWGIYPDQGSQDLLIANNLVYDTKDGSFHQHYGKDNIVSNNIFAYSRLAQVCVTRVEKHVSDIFKNNIIYWSGNTNCFARYKADKVMAVWEKNLWWCEDGEPKFRDKTFAQWQADGRDVEGIVADPLFVNPKNRDFRFKSNEVYKKIGFIPFDFSKAGIDLGD
jgi:hypothetical protein